MEYKKIKIKDEVKAPVKKGQSLGSIEYLNKENKKIFSRNVVASEDVEGLNFFKIYDPDIVLLDIMLPKKDGWQVCREIRKKSNVPIIMLTAKSETFDKILGLELGADDYIAKPFDTKELIAREGIPTAEWLTNKNGRNELKDLIPCFVKPADKRLPSFCLCPFFRNEQHRQRARKAYRPYRCLRSYRDGSSYLFGERECCLRVRIDRRSASYQDVSPRCLCRFGKNRYPFYERIN